MRNYEAEVTGKNIAEAQENRAKWLIRNGFNKEENTYIYFCPDSYNVREQLKSDGFRFSRELMWHCSIIPAGYEDKVFCISASRLVEFYVWGGAFLPTAADIVKSEIACKQPKIESNSEWIGEEKEHITDLLVDYVSCRVVNTKYGYTNLYLFETKEGSKIQWWSKCSIGAEVGSEIRLSGIVKDHSEYKGVKYTVMKNCKVTN